MLTIGKNIAYYRKEKSITQERLAELCEVTPQAVSKWENEICCPDISLLKTIARAFSITVDELLDDGESPIVRMNDVPKADKIVKLRANDETDKISLNLPLSLIEILIKRGRKTENLFCGEKAEVFKEIDFSKIAEIASLGVMGKILEVESTNGERVEVWIE